MIKAINCALLGLLFISCGKKPYTLVNGYKTDETKDVKDLDLFNNSAECEKTNSKKYQLIIANSSNSEDVSYKSYDTQLEEEQGENAVKYIYGGGYFKAYKNKPFAKSLRDPEIIQIHRCKKYKRESTYQVALNTYSFIDMSYKFLMENNIFTSIPKINLYIHPTYEVVISPETDNFDPISTFKSDNAGYGKNNILIYPQSVYKKYSTKLWEVPFVSSHEYGHHIFYQLFKSAGPYMEAHQKGFSNVLSAVFEHKVFDRTSFYLSSINEGFADLFAFITLKKEFLSIEALGCVAKDRHILRSRFAAGDFKKLTSRSIQLQSPLSFGFSSSINSFLDSKCEKLYDKDEHTLGAILAYNLNSMMNLAKISKVNKIRVLKRWLESLENSFYVDQHNEDYISNSILSFLDILENYKTVKELNKAECVYIKNMMPVVYPISKCSVR
jgi:hypothetical protein